MAEERRQEPKWRLERQGPRFGKKARHELEASSTRGRKPSRLFLRQNDWDEEEVDFREDRERPKQPD
jgi:hypothetical protein